MLTTCYHDTDMIPSHLRQFHKDPFVHVLSSLLQCGDRLIELDPATLCSRFECLESPEEVMESLICLRIPSNVHILRDNGTCAVLWFTKRKGDKLIVFDISDWLYGSLPVKDLPIIRHESIDGQEQSNILRSCCMSLLEVVDNSKDSLTSGLYLQIVNGIQKSYNAAFQQHNKFVTP